MDQGNSRSLRVDYRTIRGGLAVHYKSGLAVREGTCPWCDTVVAENEPIYLTGVAIYEGKVDLSDAEWVCGRCIND